MQIDNFFQPEVVCIRFFKDNRKSHRGYRQYAARFFKDVLTDDVKNYCSFN